MVFVSGSRDVRKKCACLPIIVQAPSDVDPAKIHILVIDSIPKSAHSIGEILNSRGYQVSVTANQSEAVALAKDKLFNLVVKVFDPDTVDAIALMNRIRTITPDTQFIFISEKGTIQVAVDAIRKGAYDYLSKPIKRAQLVESVRKALDFQALVAEDEQIKMRLRKRSDPDIFAGSNSVMSKIDFLIRQVATTDVTVLIEGESGTGKEVVARAIHERSRRNARPFIPGVRMERTFSIQPGMSLAQLEAELIRQTLLNVTSNRSETAKTLGISRRTLHYKIKRYGLGTLGKRNVAPHPGE